MPTIMLEEYIFLPEITIPVFATHQKKDIEKSRWTLLRSYTAKEATNSFPVSGKLQYAFDLLFDTAAGWRRPCDIQITVATSS